MTRQRALRLAREWAQGHVCSLRDGEAAEYHSMFAAMLEESMPNEPLTFAELEEMNGQPVYIPKLNAWGLINVSENTVYNYNGWAINLYETSLMGVYRRPPEGEA